MRLGIEQILRDC